MRIKIVYVKCIQTVQAHSKDSIIMLAAVTVVLINPGKDSQGKGGVFPF